MYFLVSIDETNDQMMFDVLMFKQNYNNMLHNADLDSPLPLFNTLCNVLPNPPPHEVRYIINA